MRFFEIGRLHAQSLGHRFRFQGRFKSHVHFTVQHLFGFRNAQRRTARQLLRELSRRAFKLSARHDAVLKTNAFGLGGVHKSSSHQQFRRFRQTNHARQKVSGAHVGSGQSDFDEDEGNLCFFSGNAKI